MKDIVKKIIVGVLAVTVVLGAAIYRFMFYDPNKATEESTQPTVTDAAGTTYYAVTNPDGSIGVIVTNANGEQYKAEFDGQTVGGTTVPVAAGEVEGTLPTNYTGPHLDVSASSTLPAVTSAQPGVNNTTAASTTQAQQGATTTTNAPAATTVAPTASQDAPQATGNKIDVYQQVFKSGNFLMQVNDPELGPVTMAMKGNKMYIDASMEDMSLKLIYNGDKKDAKNPDGTWYLILDGFKKYSTMPPELLGDMDVTELTKDLSNGDENLVYTSDVVDLNGALLVRESTVDGNGNTLNYYFDGDVLIRSETITPSGSATATDFAMITTDVSDDLFAIPAGYSYVNLEWLGSLLG